jgi:alkylhydroperoxidase family enzyme
MSNLAERPERIRMLSLEQVRAAVQTAGLPEAFAPLSVFRMLLRDPEFAAAIAGQLQHLLRGKQFDGRLRELVILRIGWATGSVYEWTQHWRVARLMEIREDDLLGVRDWCNHAGFGHAEARLELVVATSRGASRSCGESNVSRSLAPLPCSTRISIRAESMWAGSQPNHLADAQSGRVGRQEECPMLEERSAFQEPSSLVSA